MQQLFFENFFFSSYIITWIISIIYYKKYFDTPLRFLPIYIAYVIFTELLGYFIINFEAFSFFSEPEYSWHNIVIYNIYQAIMLLFFFSLYLRMLRRTTHKKMVIFCIGLTILAYLVDLFFKDPLHSSLYHADFVASFSLVFCVILYFREKKQEDRYPSLVYSLVFWISLGLLIFHLACPFLLYIGNVYSEFWLEYQLRKVLWVFISLMYLLFSVGLVIGQRKAFR